MIQPGGQLAAPTTDEYGELLVRKSRFHCRNAATPVFRSPICVDRDFHVEFEWFLIRFLISTLCHDQLVLRRLQDEIAEALSVNTRSAFDMGE
jgi:hypothetical protein